MKTGSFLSGSVSAQHSDNVCCAFWADALSWTQPQLCLHQEQQSKASLWARAGPDDSILLGWGHPSQSGHLIDSSPQVREEGGDPWLKSQPWRKAQLKYSLSSLQPPSRAVLTAWNEGHHSSWRNSSCTHWLRNYLLHTLHLPILAACLRFMNRGGNQGNVTYRIFLDIKFMSHCWSIYNSSQIAMQIFG